MADKVFSYEDQMAALTDDELKAKTVEFKQRYQDGGLWMISWRGFLQLFVKLQNGFLVCSQGSGHGGIVLHHGDVPEMRTGKGKTLTATMPVYWYLVWQGVHVVTVNEYLTEGMQQRWRTLLMAWPFSRDQPCSKISSWKKSLPLWYPYSSNSEIGFDYLRDNMVVRAENMVQRPLNYALVDEVDSILIDERVLHWSFQVGQLLIRASSTTWRCLVKTLTEDDYRCPI